MKGNDDAKKNQDNGHGASGCSRAVCCVLRGYLACLADAGEPNHVFRGAPHSARMAPGSTVPIRPGQPLGACGARDPERCDPAGTYGGCLAQCEAATDAERAIGVKRDTTGLTSAFVSVDRRHRLHIDSANSDGVSANHCHRAVARAPGNVVRYIDDHLV